MIKRSGVIFEELEASTGAWESIMEDKKNMFFIFSINSLT